LRVALTVHGRIAVKNVLLPASLLAMFSATALADTGLQTDAPAKPSGETTVPVAIGVNVPLGWKDASSIAGSLYVGVSKRLALRGNVASYDYHGGMLNDVGAAIVQADDEASTKGRITDVGVGVVHYGNRLWDGFTVEAGLLRRSKDISSADEFATPAYVATETATYSARALVGYSWLIHDHFFVSFALGMSGGHESGTETTKMDTYTSAPSTTRSVSRWDASPEGYLRIGGAFDLGGS
jgi:hypothetical protein